MRSDKRIETGARPDIDHMLSRCEQPQRKRISVAGEGFHGYIRRGCDRGIVISKTGGKPASGVEMLGAMRIIGHLAILASHLRAEGVGIDGCISTHGKLSLAAFDRRFDRTPRLRHSIYQLIHSTSGRELSSQGRRTEQA
jgi:hypothetical protein